MGCFNSKNDLMPYAPGPYSKKPPPPFSQQPLGGMVQQPMSPFMRRISPSGVPWFQYVATEFLEVDPHTGFLVGPWAECICAAVKFEHSCQWQSMPEYACGADGPAGGVLSALEQALGGPRSTFAQEKLAAASRLEEAMHQVVEMGQPMPPLHGSVTPPQASAPPYAPDSYRLSAAHSRHDYSQHCTQYGHGCPQFDGPGYGGTQYGCTPYDGPQCGGPHYGHAPQYNPSGPTLLQSRPQHQGMSTGGKVALAAGGGVVAGVAGYALATHLDDVGDALGGAVEGVGHFAGEAFEGIGGAMEGVGHFAGEAFEGVGEFVEDMF